MATKAKPKRKRQPPTSPDHDADSGREQREGPVFESGEQGLEIKPKDFRLLHAQRYAADEIKKIKPPKTEKELRAAIKRVGTAVATRLYTSPALALSAYIDPDVWKKWKRASKTPEKSPKYSVVARKAKKIDELLVERFRARWKAVETEFANGVDVAKARAHRFLASDSRARMRLARRHYGVAPWAETNS